MSDGGVQLQNGKFVYAETPVLAGDLRELVLFLVPPQGVFPGFMRGGSSSQSGGGGGGGGNGNGNGGGAFGGGAAGAPGPQGPVGPPGPALLYIGQPITGSEANSVLFVGAGNNLQQAPDVFVWDVAAQRLGINTATPARRVEIADAVDPQLRLTNTGAFFVDLLASANGSLDVLPASGLMALIGSSPVFAITGTSANQGLTINFLDNNFGALKGSVLYAGNNAPGSRYFGMYTFGADYIYISTLNAARIQFATSGNFCFSFDPNGTLQPDRPQSTGMTAGFINIPGAAGPPVGVPSNTNGFPFYWDSTNLQLYVYSGAWRASPVFV
jgi:hypothetical protein